MLDVGLVYESAEKLVRTYYTLRNAKTPEQKAQKEIVFEILKSMERADIVEYINGVWQATDHRD